MSRKTKVIGVRIDEEVDERLLRFEAATGIERVTLARNALLAALNYFDENGRITFPLKMIEGAGISTSTRPNAESIAKLRPEDKGTPVLKIDSSKTEATSPA